MLNRLRWLAVRSGLYSPVKRLIDVRWLRGRRRKGTYSQFGEDVELLATLGPNGLYIDIGANHPFKGSNTFLLYQAGWRGLTMEPIMSLCQQHRSVRPRDVCVNAAAGRSRGAALFNEVNPTGYSTFDSDSASTLVARGQAVLVRQYNVSVVPVLQAWREAFGAQLPNLISIDTEGFELEVLAGIDLSVLQPELVLLELQSAVDTGRRETLVEAMLEEGYELRREFGVNGLFQRSVDETGRSAMSLSASPVQ